MAGVLNDNQTIWGGPGSDSLSGGDGNDTLLGGAGRDSLSGDAGNDILWGEAESDNLHGGEGDDQLLGGGGGDTLSGDAGHDLLWGEDGDDLVHGGDGDDEVLGEAGNDTLSGDAGNDSLWGGAGDDLLLGGAGDDSLDGEAGNDTLLGGAGTDRMLGGEGDDTLKGGAGTDILTGGAGADLIIIEAGSGVDWITDFDMTLAGGRTVDQLDVSGLVSANGGPLVWEDLAISDDGSGNAVIFFPGGERILLQGVAPGAINRHSAAQMGLPCIARGTLIDTATGRRRIETLRAGDLVLTPEGPMPVLWAGGRRLGPDEMVGRPETQPVVIRTGALGNDRPLVLSRQHCAAIRGADGAGRLVRAAQLAALGEEAFRQTGHRRAMAWHHLLLPRHALVRANGAWVETLWPGPAGLAALGPGAGAEIAAALPRIAPALMIPDLLPLLFGPRALPLLPMRELRALGPVRPFGLPVAAEAGGGGRVHRSALAGR